MLPIDIVIAVLLYWLVLGLARPEHLAFFRRVLFLMSAGAYRT
jgi:hypothetical protein